MAALLEKYKNHLAVSQKVYARAHQGELMTEAKKIATAVCLENTNKFLKEAFENSSGVQARDLGMFKKFTMNLTTVAVPNLIAYDLVIVKPMTSITGYITYLQYTAGSNKGKTKRGKVLNDPFRLGDVDTEYTSEKISGEAKAVATATAVEGQLNWHPVIAGTVNIVHGSVVITDDGNGVLSATAGLTGTGTIDYETGKYTYTLATEDTASVPFANYVYDNVVIPQNDLPLLNVELKGLTLTAKARRIAIYYSQIAEFQAKTDYDFDMGADLAEQAVGELAWEIDTEIVNLLVASAPQDGDLVWSKSLPLGVSKQEHYAAFSEIISIAQAKVYQRTKRFNPNYMLISPLILPILKFIPGFTPTTSTDINGPYMAGTLDTLKVFVSPSIEDNQFVIGVNGNDLKSSAAVYAPYQQLHTIKNNLISVAA